MVSRILTLGLRGFQFFCTLIVLALTGAMISAAFHGNPSAINYDMFVAVFGMLSILYLIVVAINDSFAGHPGVPLLLDGLNALFYFAAAVNMAARLGAHSCSNKGYVMSNGITNGAHDMSKRCREAQATTAFLWFAVFAWLATFFFSILGARSGGVNLRGGIRRPAMSQV